MKNILTLITLVLAVSSCQNQSDSDNIRVFYPVDSLLDGQIDYLVKNKAQLLKSSNDSTYIDVQGDGTEAFWQEQLAIFSLLDINKPSLIDAYETSVDNDQNSNLKVTRYTAIENDELIKSIQ